MDDIGMFDYLVDRDLRCIWCGYSGWVGALEIQTKETEPQLLAKLTVHYDDDDDRKRCDACVEPNVFSFEEPVKHAVPSDDRFPYIRASVSCRSPPCEAISRMNDFVRLGYISGFGRTFHVTYPVKNGIVIGPATVVPEEWDNQDQYAINDWQTLEEKFRAKLVEKGPAYVESFEKKLKEKAHGQFALAVLLWHDWDVKPGV